MRQLEEREVIEVLFAQLQAGDAGNREVGEPLFKAGLAAGDGSPR